MDNQEKDKVQTQPPVQEPQNTGSDGQQSVQSSQEPKQEPKAQGKPKPEMVEVPRKQFEKLMGLIPTVEKLQKDNEALLAVADRAKLQAFNERQQQPGNRVVKLLTYIDEDRNRKVILAWSKIKDDVYKAPNGAWVEDQIMEVIFEDDTRKQLPLVLFYRSTADKIKAEVIEDRGDSFKVKTAEGKEYLIGKMFVN